MEILFVLRIHFLHGVLPFFSYPPASEGDITVMIVLYTCSEAAIHLLSVASQLASA